MNTLTVTLTEGVMSWSETATQRSDGVWEVVMADRPKRPAECDGMNSTLIVLAREIELRRALA